ncbi:MAG: SUMF1/EgtB/PvdO family nonheme iron enzyme [Myxococcales bacterium]|nr:SUMF1/EgtB/PvdO family nonheme iron enzyme [Myxococcales bacterium]
MRYATMTACAALVLAYVSGPAAAQGAKPLRKCAPDAVVSGTVCMDRYEASVWRVPDPRGANKKLVKKLQQGKAKAADLVAGGAIQLGVANDDYAPCSDSGQNCLDDIYAASLPGVKPSAHLTWFQAQAACDNAAKRLPSNAEWQAAVTGTPDPGPDNGTTDCKTTGQDTTLTGSRSACVSTRGAFDMVGNLYEWVADWVPRSTTCGAWSAEVSPTGDQQCLAGAATTGEPGALRRGGSIGYGASAGPLAIAADTPSLANSGIGFRCAR